MSSKTSVYKEVPSEKRTQTQQALWSSQEEMKRYVMKLKSELDEQKNKVKRVHRDKAEEIKRLQENLDNEREKAVENVAKKLENDKAYELRKMREAVSKQKESELREVLRLKDEEMRTLKHELHEFKNSSRVLESENKRILNERSRGDSTEIDYKRLRSEVCAFKQDKKRLEENLKVKTNADFEKSEIIRKMGHDHDVEIQRLTRESKKEAFKEFRHLKAASKQIEAKNHELETRQGEMRRLELEKNTLGNELNLQRKKLTTDKLSTSSFKKPGSEFDNVAEDKIKKLRMRNSELVAIARKLEVKAKHLHEEKEILEKSSGSNPEVGNLKKVFARQRAKDLAEHAKMLMKKDNEINNLKKDENNDLRKEEINNLNENDNVVKIVEQTAKERLLLEKQHSSKQKLLSDEIKKLSDMNFKILNNNEMLKEELSNLQDVEAKHFKTMFEMDEIRQEYKVLQKSSLENQNRITKLEFDKETLLFNNHDLQEKNNELKTKVHKMNELEDEYSMLKDNFQKLKNEYDVLMRENNKLRSQIETLATIRKEIERLEKENEGISEEKQHSVLKIEERENEIASLHQMESEAQRKHNEEVSELSDMIYRLRTQSTDIPHNGLNYVHSTPNDSKCTQTSRASSPIHLSPIKDDRAAVHSLSLQDNELTSSSTSFNLDKAATRIEQLIDSDDTDRSTTDSPFYSSELNSDDTSYSGDISETSDVELQRIDGNTTIESTIVDEQEGIFIGSQSPENLDEKLSIFIAKYSYDPILYSPNDNPELELAFQAADYLYVYGDVDEDGFFVGELMSGERGLVPSNFIERIAEEDEAILKISEEKADDDDSGERRHEMFRTSLDHVLNDQLDDIRESEEDDVSQDKRRNERTEVDQNFSDGLESMESDAQSQLVCSPSKLSLDGQFTTTALVSWQGASEDDIEGYNIYIDGKLNAHTKGNNKTNALVEDVYPSETYRLSVRTKSGHGNESPDNEATMVFGPAAKLSPYNLKVSRITEVSADVWWLPSNSCYGHEIILDDVSLVCLKPSISTYTLSELTPSTAYRVRIQTQIPNDTKLTLGQDDFTSEIEFTTLTGGLPDPPVHLRLYQQTSEVIILTWLPVTISEDGYSNGYKVTNYKVYVNEIYCMETDWPSVDTVTINNERLYALGKRHDFTRMRFVVRTQSVVGESVDSNVVDVLSSCDVREEEGDACTSRETEELPCTTKEVYDDISTSREREGLPCTSREVQDNTCTSRETEELPCTTKEVHDDVCTSREREELPCTTKEVHDDVCTSREREEIPCTTKEVHDDVCTSREREENPCTVQDRRELSDDISFEDLPCSSEDGMTSLVKEPAVFGGSSIEPRVVHYNVEEEETESESCTAESITDEVVEIFNNKVTNVENETIKQKDTEEKDIRKDNEELSSITSDSDYEELLSVIDEVDEDNLTTTTTISVKHDSIKDDFTNTSQSYSENNTEFIKDKGTPQSSVRSESKTLSSDDDGFKTEDDVLDLLEDDDCKLMTSNDQMIDEITNEVDTISDQLVDQITNEVDTINDQLVDQITNEVDTINETQKEDNMSSETSRTSLDSLSSISPPRANEAIETIINTLSLPHDSLRTSEVFSDRSETDEMTSERYFVALYEYDPLLMSPNEDGAEEELAFNEGDLVKVFGDKDDDGFFWGECKKRQGYVPSNMITEVNMDEAEELFNEAHQNGGHYISSYDIEDHHKDNGHCHMVTTDFLPTIPYDGYNNRLSFWDENGDLGPRKMRALFDYNPVQDSPNVDREVELMFEKGETIYVFGEMDDDGFFQGELDGIRGLVPSNFLEPDPQDETPTSPKPSSSKNEERQSKVSKQLNGKEEKKKKGLFSKGKKIFKKAFR